MTIVARRFASTPMRTATETWSAIVDVLSPDDGAARQELEAAAGVLGMLIADEVTRSRPLVVSGTGPQLRIYTIHGEDAVDGTNVSEGQLAVTPTIGTWTLALPVPQEDVDWVSAKVASLPHVVVADLGDPSEVTAVTKANGHVPVIDISKLTSP